MQQLNHSPIPQVQDRAQNLVKLELEPELGQRVELELKVGLVQVRLEPGQMLVAEREQLGQDQQLLVVA